MSRLRQSSRTHVAKRPSRQAPPFIVGRRRSRDQTSSGAFARDASHPAIERFDRSMTLGGWERKLAPFPQVTYFQILSLIFSPSRASWIVLRRPHAT
jgi:hypothetical protein